MREAIATTPPPRDWPRSLEMARAWVARLLAYGPKSLHLEQYNPARKLEVARGRIESIHRVMPCMEYFFGVE